LSGFALKRLWGGRRGRGNFVAAISSWLVGGVLPGIERQPRKKLEPSPERLLAVLQLDGEIVPASEKLVSPFEPHADIIVKGGRQVQYGHKLNLATGKSGLILDIVIETGNPADAERFVSMLDRHIARTGAPPRQTAADGGYASCANLAAAKARGVADVAFHKKCGIAIIEMVKSPWIYRRLRNFRAGIEAAISIVFEFTGGRHRWRNSQRSTKAARVRQAAEQAKVENGKIKVRDF
jgi:IS5 family transposase